MTSVTGRLREADGSGHRKAGKWAATLRAGRVSYHFTFAPPSANSGIHVTHVHRAQLVSRPRARRFGRAARLAARRSAGCRPVKDIGNLEATRLINSANAAAGRRARDEGVRGRTPAEGRPHSAVAARQPQRRARTPCGTARRRLLHDRQPQQPGRQGAGARRDSRTSISCAAATGHGRMRGCPSRNDRADGSRCTRRRSARTASRPSGI